MPTGFVSTLPGGIEVAHRPAEKDWGGVDLDSPPKGCCHTTEGTGLPTYGAGQSDAPTFTIGPAKVWQHRALGRGCGTLQNDEGGVATNTLVRIQIEIIGFASRQSWLPTASFQREAIAAVKDLAHEELGVPRTHVWPDLQDADDMDTEAHARRHAKFPQVAGWYGHVEIPENDHWDPGSLRWEDLGLESAPDLVDALAFVARVRRPDGKSRSREISPFFATKSALRNWAVVADGPNANLEDDLRKEFFDALCENRVWVARRKVGADLVQG